MWRRPSSVRRHGPFVLLPGLSVAFQRRCSRSIRGFARPLGHARRRYACRRRSVAASGNILRPSIAPARSISAFHRASRRPAPSAQVTISRVTGVAPAPWDGWRVAYSNVRAGETPAEGGPVRVTRPQTSVLSLGAPGSGQLVCYIKRSSLLSALVKAMA